MLKSQYLYFPSLKVQQLMFYAFFSEIMFVVSFFLHHIFLNIFSVTKPVCIDILSVRCMGRPPLWHSGQSSWIQIQRSGFDFRHYQIFWEVMDLERGPLSLVSTIEELLELKSSGSGLENGNYGCRDSPRWLRDTPNFADKQRSRSVDIVRSQT
jgi:hypothetical protein